MKKPLLLLLSLFFVLIARSYAQTNVAGNINVNTTWTKANSPYVLTGNVGIPSAYTLTIEPGVTVQRTADYQVLINGAVKIIGTQADSIVFSSSGALGTTNTFFIEFQKSNLSNSSLKFVSFRNQSNNANNLRIGNESEFSQTSPKNSGSLAVANSNLSYGYTATKGYQAATSLDIDNCLAISATIIGYYPISEAINISNSRIFNSTINSDSYNMGIKLDATYVRNCSLLMGCCSANYTINNSKLEDSKIIDGGGSPDDGPVHINNSLFLNSYINNPAAHYDIVNSQFIITKNILNLAGSQAGYIMSLGNMTMSHSELINLTAFNYSGLLLSGNNGYNTGGANSITNNLFSNLYDVFYTTNFATITFDNNNLIKTSRYFIANYSLKNFSALNNYLQLKPGKTIDDMIFDSNDDLKYGIVTYSPSSVGLNTGPPVSRPVNVLKVKQGSNVNVIWNKNKEANIKNYKVYWGFVSPSAYANSATIAATDTSYTISGASITDSIAVTALNTSSTGVNDQLNGYESWYASASQPIPILTSFTPLTAASGATITLTGINLNGLTAVSFGGVNATSFTIVSPTTVTAIVGAGASGSVSATSGGGTSNLTGFVFIPAPVITSFTPTAAGAAITVTINGSNFTGVTSVTFGGVAATSFSIVSPTKITAVVGAGATGSLSVISPGGTTTATGFTFVAAPTITAFTPVSAKAGSIVTITGTEFSNATAVNFGSTAATSFTVMSATTIAATVAAGASGSVAVTTAGGTATLAGFTFIPAPAITSFSPAASITGTTVTVTGTNFTGTTAVSFGGAPATSFTVVSPTTITAVVSSASLSGSVTITGPGGVVSQGGFTFTPTPIITSFTPTASVTGGLVTITGSNFTGTTSVTFGGIVATSFNVVSSTSITATVGIAATGSVVVTTPGGSATLNGFSYNNNLPANNFSIVANSATCKGSANGGISITALQSLNYTATITGGSLTGVTYPFTKTTAINNLPAGTYNVCFTATGLTGYQQCFTIVITEPKDLAVYTALNTNTNSLTLNLDGGSNYNVQLNGVTTTTSANLVTLQLATGVNNLKISTDKPCQGVIEKQINTSDKLIPYPNPFINTLTVNLGSEVVANAFVNIYTLSNTKVFGTQISNKSGAISIDVSNLTSGIYVLKLATDKAENTFKIIKK
jgi:hypothetical protein